jgi:hypothetical protein
MSSIFLSPGLGGLPEADRAEHPAGADAAKVVGGQRKTLRTPDSLYSS